MGAINRVEFDSAQLFALNKGDTVSFDLPRGKWDAVSDTITVHDNTGDKTWVGYSKSDGKAFRTILTFGNDGTVLGSIRTPFGTYAVHAAEGGPWLVDTNAAPSLPEHHPAELRLPDGRVIAEIANPKTLRFSPIFQLTLPEYFRQKTYSLIQWRVPEGYDPTRKATFRFSKDGVNWGIIKRIKMYKGMFYWRPGKKRITETGMLQICAKPQKGKTVVPVCETVPEIKVIPYDAPIPVDTEAPSIPQNLKASSDTTSVILSWQSAYDNRGVVGYRLYRNGLPHASVTGTTFTDTKLLPETEFSYQVSAFDAAGNESTKSAPLSVSTLSDTTAPSVPVVFSAVGTSISTIKVSWGAASDNVGVTGYNVHRDKSLIATVTGITFSDSGLLPGTTHVYRIEAFDAAGNKALSAAVSGTTKPVGSVTMLPTVPTGLKATKIGHSYLVLEWNPSVDENPTGYIVYRDGVAVYTGMDRVYVDRLVTAGRTYSYTVTAVDGSQHTRTSAPYSVTAKALPPVSIVDILIYYQSDSPGGITSVSNAVDLTNQAFIDSGVNMQLNPVAIIPVDYPATESNRNALLTLSNSQAPFSRMESLKKHYKADLVAFLRPYAIGHGNCGIAFLNPGSPDLNVLDPASVYSVTNFGGDFCPDGGLPHELGHNMGLNHDDVTRVGDEGLYSYSKGYMLSDGSHGDIMSHANWHGVLMYSSPDIIVDGMPLGESNEADAAASLRQTRGAVSEFDELREVILPSN